MNDPGEQGNAPSKASRISLREINADTVRAICALEPREDQRQFVAPNALSLAEASYSDAAWVRALYADETPVGFVMLSDNPVKPQYYIWRFMLDARYQRLGFGAQAIRLLIEHVRGRPGAKELELSVVQGPGGPQPFYEGLGFRLTGEFLDEEAMMTLSF